MKVAQRMAIAAGGAMSRPSPTAGTRGNTTGKQVSRGIAGTTNLSKATRPSIRMAIIRKQAHTPGTALGRENPSTLSRVSTNTTGTGGGGTPREQIINKNSRTAR